MKRRTLVMRVGDHWFLRHVRDLYETLTSKYTTKDQPRGILSIFPETVQSPFWFRKRQDSAPRFNEYLKDKQSERAFTEEMDAETELKIYVAGHGNNGLSSLHSLEAPSTRDFLEPDPMDFRISVQAVAWRISKLLNDIKVRPTAACPVKISLIVCHAASGTLDASNSFASQLLEKLHELGHNHLLVKAREESVSAPIFGKKYTSGKKAHFYLGDDTIYHVYKDDDLRKQVLKVFKKCHASTSITTKSQYLNRCIQQISELGYSGDLQIAQLKAIIENAKQDADVTQFRYGTGWLMKILNKKSNTEMQLDKLLKKINSIEASTPIEYKELVDLTPVKEAEPLLVLQKPQEIKQEVQPEGAGTAQSLQTSLADSGEKSRSVADLSAVIPGLFFNADNCDEYPSSHLPPAKVSEPVKDESSVSEESGYSMWNTFSAVAKTVAVVGVGAAVLGSIYKYNK